MKKLSICIYKNANDKAKQQIPRDLAKIVGYFLWKTATL